MKFHLEANKIFNNKKKGGEGMQQFGLIVFDDPEKNTLTVGQKCANRFQSAKKRQKCVS